MVELTRSPSGATSDARASPSHLAVHADDDSKAERRRRTRLRLEAERGDVLQPISIVA
jgi:hypothetical protein